MLKFLNVIEIFIGLYNKFLFTMELILLSVLNSQLIMPCGYNINLIIYQNSFINL